MDLRDSSMDVSRDDGGGGNDGVLSVSSLLAKEALSLFQSKKFDECVEALNRLLRDKENDLKILHNIAVAEFLRDGCSDPKRLLEVLVNVKRKSEDFARVSKEQANLTAQSTNKAIPGAKGTNNLANNSSTVYSDEFDASVAALNIATVLFHLHEYPKALLVLEPLFQNIEPIDETTALHVCLLLLDVAFSTQDAYKFADVINYLEKTFGVSFHHNQGDGASVGLQQVSSLVLKSSSVPNNSSATDDLSTEGIAARTASEDSLSRTLSDETMEYENLLSTLDISGQNIPRPSNFSPQNERKRSTPPVNLKLLLPVYKIQLLLLTGNLKAAKREVNLVMNIARGLDSSRTLLLKSQLEYARGNYPKAFKLLKASSNQDDVGSSIMINNNIGCIYYHQGQHRTSSIFFHKALSNCSSLWKEEKPKKLATFSQDKSLLISYNCGVQYLSCGKPILAARCFLKASLVFYNRPLMWLRLAECCIMAREIGLLKHNETPVHESDFRVQVIGQGKWRQLAIQNGSWRTGQKSSDDGVDLVLDYIKPKLSLAFARQCLHNALHLLGCFELKRVKSGSSSSKNSGHKNVGNNDTKSNLPSSGQVSTNGDARERRSGVHGNTAAANVISEYEEIRRRENHRIKQAILTDLAFVELELGNPRKALSAALSLLKLSECSKMHAFLGHVYAAEALCLLNMLTEAAEHLSTYLSSGSNANLPYTKEDCRQWQARKTVDFDDSNSRRVPSSEELSDKVFLAPEEARGSLYVNLASMFVMQGDLEQASRYTKQALTIMPNNREAVLMAIYLDLKLGKAEEALMKLKRRCRVRFFPLNSRLKAAC